ncbi:hypothetical protein M2165_002669 [Variovorax sp. TBS-050B]|jgi:hypothetical protein|uniref:hypothetical protein n=1 Tax=Variovorax sp. TBS-050B TaxID=2940551 RepID=UPI0024745D84|nr:hypothetical protein [Variovorax sp. TBS-050B]MDH6592780.1 hypothetical protein [Variovorax sp. TBS-050B]
MTLKSDIVSFLKRDLNVARLNFAVRSLRVYPSAYQIDVADAIASGAFKLGNAVSSGAGASYNMDTDIINLRDGFSISNASDQAFLVHECTHAHLDIQTTGKHSGHENEAAAYLAEAMYLEAAGQPQIGGQAVRNIAHPIARKLLAGRYAVEEADILALTAAVAAVDIYAKEPIYTSNGFKRSMFYNWVRGD